MIIKNNFNTKSVNPLEDYDCIGKGSHNVDKEIELEKEGFIKEILLMTMMMEITGNYLGRNYFPSI